MGTIHSSERIEFVCSQCPKTYISKCGLKKHLASRHSKPVVKSRKPPSEPTIGHAVDVKLLPREDEQLPAPHKSEIFDVDDKKHSIHDEATSEPREASAFYTSDTKEQANEGPASGPQVANNCDSDDAQGMPASEPLNMGLVVEQKEVSFDKIKAEAPIGEGYANDNLELIAN